MIEAQNKIKAVVEQYKIFYPEEYRFVARQIADKRKNLNNKFAKTKGMDYAERALTEVPETLFGLFQKTLSEDEVSYYASKEGTRWFAKTFPDFRSGEKV